MDKLKNVIKEYGRWSIEEKAFFRTLLILGVALSSTELRVQISLPTVSSKALAFSSEWLKSISIWRNNNVDSLTREFLIDTVELVSVFLIRNFETKHLRTAHETLTDS
jgi:hypothetical protein